ncbi:DUF6314 family protein [Puniceibacterium confluentis]|uniref:DUF6314 family protein n=1 Tax=Puniceibacterium confluentis TaxID=1958944 RepID=UPI00356888B3
MRALELLDFVGSWRIRRRIDDRRAGQVVQADGQAVLKPAATGLVYDEQIRLFLPGQAPLDGHRRYLWRASADGIAVLFADGRAFHAFVPDSGVASAAHWCDPDQYDVGYDFSDWPCWRSTWEVSGPRKCYRMDTEYVPQTGGGQASGAAAGDDPKA